MKNEVLYLNGDFMPLSEGRIGVEDRGMQFGDGVYEVIKIMNRRLVWLDDHLVRLRRSLGEIRLESALEGHALDSVLPQLVGRSGVEHGIVYMQVTRGFAPRDFLFPCPPEPTVLAYARNRPPCSESEIRTGLALHAVEDMRWARCDIKSTNLLGAVLAKQQAHDAGAQEAVMYGPEGTVREGASSNIFAFIRGVLRTHPLGNRILGGITRLHALELAGREGFALEERAFTLDELRSAGRDCEVFIAATSIDLLPVVRIDDHVVGDGRPGRLTLALLDVMRREQALSVGLQPPPALS